MKVVSKSRIILLYFSLLNNCLKCVIFLYNSSSFTTGESSFMLSLYFQFEHCMDSFPTKFYLKQIITYHKTNDSHNLTVHCKLQTFTRGCVFFLSIFLPTKLKCNPPKLSRDTKGSLLCNAHRNLPLDTEIQAIVPFALTFSRTFKAEDRFNPLGWGGGN